MTRIFPSNPIVKIIPKATGTRKFVKFDIIVSLMDVDTLSLVKMFIAGPNKKSLSVKFNLTILM